MREELVPESFAFARSLDEACDIDELDGCRDDLGSTHYCSDLLEAFIVHIHYTSVGLYGTKWEIRSLSGIRLRESIEQSRLTNIRETDDTDLHNY